MLLLYHFPAGDADDGNDDGQVEKERYQEEGRKARYASSSGVHRSSLAPWSIRPFFRSLRTMDGTAREPRPP